MKGQPRLEKVVYDLILSSSDTFSFMLMGETLNELLPLFEQ